MSSNTLYLTTCKMVHLRRKCSIFSSSSPQSWHMVSTWFWLNRALLAYPLIYIKTVSTRDANRIPIKLKVVSGQYILQANRARFNQNQVDTICQLCGEEEESYNSFFHWYFVYGDSNNQYISGKSYFHISDFTSVNQLLLFISLTLRTVWCLLDFMVTTVLILVHLSIY
jgi:hypothetical protein